MKVLRAGPPVLGVSALLTATWAIADVGGLSGRGSGSDDRLTSILSQPPATGGDECPSPEEIEAYWDEHGEDMKSAGTCGDPDPLPPGDGTGEPPSDGQPAPTPRTLAEAQEMLDPDDDPLLLLNQDQHGLWSAILVTMVSGQELPPDVRTVEQFSAWLDVQATS